MPIGFQVRLHTFIFAMCLSGMALAAHSAGHVHDAITLVVVAIALKSVVIAGSVRAIVCHLRGIEE